MFKAAHRVFGRARSHFAKFPKSRVLPRRTGMMLALPIGLGATMLACSQDITSSASSGNDLPMIALSEVEKHNHMGVGVWVTYQGLVYDITDFISAHPGGPDKIIMAAGGSLEPFWMTYTIHKDKALVKEILAEHLIGRLSEKDQSTVNSDLADYDNPYCNEPQRHPALVIQSKEPFNSEVPSTILADSFITPNAFWYVRHHHPVPDIDPEDFTLMVAGIGMDMREYTLKELKTLFPAVTETVTLQCAGNRRSGHNEIAKTSGLNWGVGAISTATWTGARLSDVLAHAGFDPDKNPDAKHVWFCGADAPYDASIPVDKAMSPTGDVLLAYKMNGTDVPRDHGFPIRAVVPGHLGARSVKWVESVITSDEMSPSTWQSGAPYRHFPPGLKNLKGVDITQYAAVQELPIQSAITYPQNAQQVTPTEGMLKVKGYAWSGGGTGVERVDITADGGNTWMEAKVLPPPSGFVDEEHDTTSNRCWSWRHWEAEVPVDNSGNVTIMCKATDSHHNTQPRDVKDIWNLRGILNNSWHSVVVDVVNSSD